MPIFGWTVARQLEEAWDRLGRPGRFTVREFGAGTGALAAGIVEGLARSGSPLRAALRYRIAERSSERERQVAGRLEQLGAADVLEPDDGAAVVGAVLANEVLDALPVHQVEGREDGGSSSCTSGSTSPGTSSPSPVRPRPRPSAAAWKARASASTPASGQRSALPWMDGSATRQGVSSEGSSSSSITATRRRPSMRRPGEASCERTATTASTTTRS